jgi:hypothetical protein
MVPGQELKLFGPDGARFLTFQEIAEENDRLAQKAKEAESQREKAERERDEAANERDVERQRAERMAVQLRALGIEPAGQDWS